MWLISFFTGCLPTYQESVAIIENDLSTPDAQRVLGATNLTSKATATFSDTKSVIPVTMINTVEVGYTTFDHHSIFINCDKNSISYGKTAYSEAHLPVRAMFATVAMDSADATQTMKDAYEKVCK